MLKIKSSLANQQVSLLTLRCLLGEHQVSASRRHNNASEEYDDEHRHTCNRGDNVTVRHAIMEGHHHVVTGYDTWAKLLNLVVNRDV